MSKQGHYLRMGMHLEFRGLWFSRKGKSSCRNGLASVDETSVDIWVKPKKVKGRECWQKSQETECKPDAIRGTFSTLSAYRTSPKCAQSLCITGNH